MNAGAGCFDVAVIGAGPSGCTAALAHARKGARVVLLEANPRCAERLAGEWLHPGGVAVLRGLGLDPHALSPYDSGRGFVVFPEDGSASVVLPYPEGARGWSGEHVKLVGMLREAAAAHANVVYLPGARVQAIEGKQLSFQRMRDRGTCRVNADLIVGADGRSSCVRSALGLPSGRRTLSRMAGLLLEGAPLEYEAYGHVFLAGPGPALAYRIREDGVRLCLDLPPGLSHGSADLWDAYAEALPEAMRPAFAGALRAGAIAVAVNQARPRTSYGGPGVALVGDAVGHQHPLTAVGMTLGLADGSELARLGRFARWQRARRSSSRVAEMLAAVLYEVFSSDTEATAAMRQGVYALWRRNPRECERTMRYLAGEEGQLLSFVRSFARVTAPALAWLSARRLRTGGLSDALEVARELAARAGWLLRGVLGVGGSPGTAAAPPTLKGRGV